MSVETTQDILTCYLGAGACSTLDSVLAAWNAKAVMLVVDKAAYEASGAASALQPSLDSRRTLTFTDFQPNPSCDDVQPLVELLANGDFDAVVAVGGGSAIDVAKVAAMCHAMNLSAHEIVDWKCNQANGEIESRLQAKLPVVTITTTSGTGAQATHFVAMYRDGVKCSVAHTRLLPEVAIVDPVLTYSMPSRLTAATGLDALCQAVESMWAVGATDESREFARRAAGLAWANLEAAVLRPDAASRLAMAKAAHLAGRAINISKTTAAHAMSYHLTTEYEVPHGMAVGLTLGPLLVFNSEVGEADCLDTRGHHHTHKVIQEITGVFGASSPQAAADKFDHLLQAIGAPQRLSQVGIQSDQQLTTLARSVNAERLGNNPRRLNADNVLGLLSSVR